jgi:hypothetical protein
MGGRFNDRTLSDPDAVLHYILLPDFFKVNIGKCGMRNAE